MALGWVATMLIGVVGAAVWSGPTSEAFDVPGTEAQRANTVIQERFPELTGDRATASVVVAHPDVGAEQVKAALDGIVSYLGAGPEVADVSEPTAAPNGNVELIEVTFSKSAEEISDEARTHLDGVTDVGRSHDVQVEMRGDATSPPGETGSEFLGLAVAAVVLAVVLGSLWLAGLPLAIALVSNALAISGVVIISGFTDVNSDTPALALMLGLAVSIDYALFIIARYHDELNVGHSSETAMGHAVGAAGSSVVVAGLTVVVALAALAVVNIPVLTQIGLAAAATVALAVLVSITLLPALLAMLGRRAHPRQRRRSAGAGRWPRLVTSRRWIATLVPVAALIVLAAPALDLRLGLPDDGTKPADSTQRHAYDLTSESFGPGFNGPFTVVVESPDASAAVEDVVATLVQVEGIVTAEPGPTDSAGSTGLVFAIPSTGPSAADTEKLLDRVRDRLDSNSPDSATVSVTGQTALDIDTTHKVADVLPIYLLVVIGFAILLLTLLFRSAIVPLKAVVGFLLSLGATFGAVVAVFQWGWLNSLLGLHASGVIVNLLPIMLIGIVFGLSMDYEVFIASRIREAHDGEPDPIRAVNVGVTQGARVVTAAALIMISVFAGFMLSDTPMVQSFGFALAFAVFIDAFVVRMTIVPATMAILGRAAWWLPRALDKILPHLTTEAPPAPAPPRTPSEEPE